MRGRQLNYKATSGPFRALGSILPRSKKSPSERGAEASAVTHVFTSELSHASWTRETRTAPPHPKKYNPQSHSCRLLKHTLHRNARLHTHVKIRCESDTPTCSDSRFRVPQPLLLFSGDTCTAVSPAPPLLLEHASPVPVQGRLQPSSLDAPPPGASVLPPPLSSLNQEPLCFICPSPLKGICCRGVGGWGGAASPGGGGGGRGGGSKPI